MSQPIRDQGGHRVFSNRPENTNLGFAPQFRTKVARARI